MKNIGLLCVFTCFAGCVLAQSTHPPMPKQGKNDTIKVAAVELDGEMIPWILLKDVSVYDHRTFTDKDARDNYYRLKYNVLKVAPYAMFAGNRYRQLERDLALTGDKAKQKEMINACETKIKDLFNREIKNLTITQGEILIKLVNRETGNTSYEMLRQMKGGINAFIFQSVARVFGHDLKETYDPEQERDIESILHSAGYISFNQ